MTDHYQNFRKLTDEQYPFCTLAEKLAVYVQHRPGSVVPFLEQLIRELYPDDWENDDRQDPDPD